MANLTIKNDSAVAEIRNVRITANGPVAQYAGRVCIGEYVSVPLKLGSTYKVTVDFHPPEKLENEKGPISQSKEIRMDSDEKEVFF
jgi:hypothetical protein